ncbi:MAG: hypothetical protein LWX83_07960 [Anaerolineae bacterium]|nr:hypothetical protein [Anaerolineae bacterium]
MKPSNFLKKSNSKIQFILSRFSFDSNSFPLLTALLFTFIFGLFIPKMGFFWDDWVQLLSKHLYGFPAYMRYFYERPLSGWTHIVFGPLMGDETVRWQIFTLSLRWACVLSAWWLFQLIWPRLRLQAVLAALLFAVYPGFTQQSIAVAYHQHWLQYLLFILSLVFMALALRQTRRSILFTILALVLQALQFSITEFFVGVELLRPLIIWILLNNPAEPQNKPAAGRHLSKTLLNWLPYLLLMLFYVIWRIFLMPLPQGHQNTPELLSLLRSQPLTAGLHIGRHMVIDTLNSLVVVWGKVFDLRLANNNQPIILLSWGISLIIAIGLGFYLLHLRTARDENPNLPRHLEVVFLGLAGLVVANAPLWLTDQDILWAVNQDVYHSDRFTLAAMLWGSLLLTGLIGWLMERWQARAVFVAVLVGLLAGFQMRNANDYRWLSLDQSEFYWQLSWRAPMLKPGTALLSEEVLFPYQGMFATASAVNLLYPQPQNPDQVDYWAYALKPRFENPTLGIQSVSFDTRVRLYHFQGSSANSLMLSYGAPRANCLWVLRPQDVDAPDLSPLAQKWLAVSNLNRILPQQQAAPSTSLFGSEPEHGWCYYYEKADLARQLNDWQSGVALANAALDAGYRPTLSGSNSVFEWQPFIEAYAHTGHWLAAADLMLGNYAFDSNNADFICNRWKALYAAAPAQGEGREDANRRVLESARCAP